MIRTTIYFLLVLVVVASISAVSARLWGGKPEQVYEGIDVVINDDMTIAEFGKEYGLGEKSLKKIFDLGSYEELKKKVSDLGFNRQQLNKKSESSQSRSGRT